MYPAFPPPPQGVPVLAVGCVPFRTVSPPPYICCQLLCDHFEVTGISQQRWGFVENALSGKGTDSRKAPGFIWQLSDRCQGS